MKVKITGLTFRQRLHLLLMLLVKRPRFSDPVWIEFTQDTRPRHYHSLWYGGEVGVIHYKDWMFQIYANGDIFANLYDMMNGCRHLEYVKDKGNRGEFGMVMNRYFPNDRQLIKALSYRHRRYRLDMDDNNWWECFAIDSRGYRYDMMWDLDSWDLFSAAAEILHNADQFIEELHNCCG